VLTGFKNFISRGNVVELAVAVVIGAAFGAVVTSLVADLITPIIGAILGESDFSGLTFEINGSEFRYGNFINALISFLIIAAAIYFLVVVPLEALERHRKGPEGAKTHPCPKCLSEVPVAATRCAFCTSEISAG
jgi:large conductance mechanosensitive channel